MFYTNLKSYVIIFFKFNFFYKIIILHRHKHFLHTIIGTKKLNIQFLFW